MIAFKFNRLDRRSSSPCSVTVAASDEVYVSLPTGGSLGHSVPGVYSEGPRYDVVVQPAILRCLLAGSSSLRVSRFGADPADFVQFKLARTERDDSDFFRQDFVMSRLGVLFVYERGLMLFSGDLDLKWEKAHQRIDWFFERVDDRFAIYRSEHEGCWAYDLSSGERRDWTETNL